MLNPEPCKSYSIASRCLCMKCGVEPEVEVKGEGSGPFSITAHCHGDKQTKGGIMREQLVFTLKFFDEEE